MRIPVGARLVVAAACLVLLSACAQLRTGQGDTASDGAAAARPTDSAVPLGLDLGETPLPSPSAVQPKASENREVADIPGAILEPVLADASERSGVPRAALVIVRASAVIWSDGSLGCPEPGMFYTQALVDGHHIVVAAGDRELDYRLDASGSFRLCGNPGPLPSGGVVDR